MATLFLDLEAGSDAADGASFANRVKTFGRASALAQPGDTVRVMASLDAQNLGTNVSWVDGQSFCTCATPQVALIDVKSAWTASTNVTYSATATRRSGATASQITIAAGFTTGKAAYFPLGTTVDFSAYQQLSLVMQFASGIPASNIDICLCSDALGNTPVDTLTIPAAPSASTSNWLSVVLNKGTALGSSIQSIAVYINSDQGPQTVVLDNMVACKAAGTAGELNHRTLIGKPNSAGCGGSDTELWYPIRSFGSGGKVFFDSISAGIAVTEPAVPVYRGITETISGRTQKLSTGFNTVPTANVGSDYFQFVGTASSRITVSGGWDRTAMTTQTGYTWMSYAGYLNTVSFVPGVISACMDMSRIYFSLFHPNPQTVRFLNCTIDKVVSCGAFNLQLTGGSAGYALVFGTAGITGIKSTIAGGKGVNLNGDPLLTLNNVFGSVASVEGTNSSAANTLTSYTFDDGRVYTSPWVTDPNAKLDQIKNNTLL